MTIKALILLYVIATATCCSFSVSAQTNLSLENISSKIKTNNPMNKVKDEMSFVKYSNAALELMEKKAREISIIGVAIVGYIPGDKTSTWVTKMKVVDVLANAKSNYLAIAYSKAAEMASTLQNSGIDKSRPILSGEFGYQGGLIRKIEGGYIIVVFSGGTSEQDLQVSEVGLNAL
jgi:hypothetical protein